MARPEVLKPRRERPRAATASGPPRAPAGRRGWATRAAVPIAAIGLAVAWWGIHRSPRLNLLLVTIDTLRADHLGVYGDRAAQTRTLDSLAARGVRFEHAQSPVPMTGPSHATILTGLYPPVHGVRDNVVFSLDPRHRTLATLLKARGYRTAAFVGAYPVAAAFGFRQGFDTFSEDFKESPIPGAGAQRPANDVVDATLGWLAAPADPPFFVWMHLYDPHAPYDPPEPYRTAFAGRPYDGEIAFADAQLGRLFDWLRSSGHEQDTVVAVLSDHGESLGEHREVTHAVLLYESTLRVPFLLAGPNVPSGVTVSGRVTTVDVAPTLLRLLGLEPSPEMTGRHLGPAFRGERLPPEPLYAESLFGRLNCRWSSLRAWTAGDWKLIDGSRAELFHLPEDPGETRDRAAEEPPRVARMRADLRAAMARMAPGGDHARTAAITPEQEANLKSLGYVGGSGGGGELDEPGLPDPRDRVQFYERMQIILRAQNIPLERASAEAVAIAEADPGNPFAQTTVASLAYRAGRLSTAARAYHRSLELDPDRPAVRQNYGKLLRDMNRMEDSEKELRFALQQTDASDRRTRSSLAETLVLVGKTEEAGRLIGELLRTEPKDPEALAAQGRLFAAQGKLEEAAKSLAAAAASADTDARIDLARVYTRLGDHARAREEAGAVLTTNPGHPWALAVLGQVVILQGHREEGLTLLRRAEAARPRRPEAWRSLAEGFDAARDGAAAARCRRAAQALRGD
ncbi:MAG: tetratricopeptide repeat protein [Chloroflexi bacterium]|nr:MAG: tetratricopeptide repeat protein [Chloroflexota bacterium]